MADNVFERLFKFRPGEERTPAENFLTEALAYTLLNVPRAASLLCERLLKVEPGDVQEVRGVDTQRQLQSSDGTAKAVVDMMLSCSLKNGAQRSILCEHKWGSETDTEQLDRYKQIAAESDGRVAFICTTAMQEGVAKGYCDTILRWEDVYKLFSGVRDAPRLLEEFIEFLDAEGLGPMKPISVAMLAAYKESRDLPDICKELAQRLKQLEWRSLPPRFREAKHVATDRIRWGRVGLDFGRVTHPDDVPGLFAGFRLEQNRWDHLGKLLSLDRGVDLMFVIQGPPGFEINSAVLGDRAGALRAAYPELELFPQDELKKNADGHGKLIVLKPARDVLRTHKTEDEQLAAVFDCLDAWCAILFENGREDGALIKAINEAWPVSDQ